VVGIIIIDVGYEDGIFSEQLIVATTVLFECSAILFGRIASRSLISTRIEPWRLGTDVLGVRDLRKLSDISPVRTGVNVAIPLGPGMDATADTSIVLRFDVGAG
jgi:hypothetical protein